MSETDEIPKERARQIDASLSRMDRAVQEVVSELDGSLSVCRDGIPERSVVGRMNEKLRCKLGVSPVLCRAGVGWQPENYEFWVMAHVWVDDKNVRRSWVKKIAVIDDVPEEYAKARALLQSALNAIKQVKETDLKLANDVRL